MFFTLKHLLTTDLNFFDICNKLLCFLKDALYSAVFNSAPSPTSHLLRVRFFPSSTIHLVSHCSAAKELFPGPVANTLTTSENLSKFFPSTVSICIQIWQLIWCLSQLQLTIQHLWLQTTYLNVPHTGRVIQSRVHLAHFLRIFDIPHIQAVVIVYTGKPLVGGVKGQGNCVWILRISHTREKAAAKQNNSLVNWRSLGAGAMLKQDSSDSPWDAIEMNNILWHLQVEGVVGQEDLSLGQLESQKKPESPTAKVFLLAIQL